MRYEQGLLSTSLVHTVDGRVEIQARISHLKRSFELRRTTLWQLPGTRTLGRVGIFAYNLQHMTVGAG